MKHIVLILSLLVFVGCQSDIKGDGPANKTKVYHFTNIKEINFQTNAQVKFILNESDSTKVEIQSHQNLIENLEVSQKDDILKLSEKENVMENDVYMVTIYVNQKILDLNLAKGTNAQFFGRFIFNELKLGVKDSAKITELDIQGKQLNLRVEDFGRVEMSGHLSQLDLHISDFANAQMKALFCDEADIDASGETKTSLTVIKELAVNATEKAEVFYLSDPNKKIKSDDQSIVRKIKE